MAESKMPLEDAAARPTRDAPLSEIETRLRRRRRMRQGAVGVCALALIGAVGGGVALTTDDGPSVRTGSAPAAQTVTAATEPAVTVTLPDGWVGSPIEPGLRFENEVLTVGTALQPSGESHGPCPRSVDPDEVFVVLREVTTIRLLENEIDPIPVESFYLPRPSDFSSAPYEAATCDPTRVGTEGWRIEGFGFQDAGRSFFAEVSIGPAALPEPQAEAFDVLNSLVVAPYEPTDIPLPTTTPPSTVPPSPDTEAITAAFLGWIDTRPIDASGVYIEDFASIRDAVIGAAEANGHPDEYTGRVEAIIRVGESDADVIYSFIIDGQPVVANLHGRAVKIDGVWKVSRDTVCEALLQGPVHCPPRN